MRNDHRSLFSRLIPLLLVVTLLISATPLAALADLSDAGGVVSGAVTGITGGADAFKLKIASLRKKFPEGKFWNHVVYNESQRHDNLGEWDSTYADSVTSTPCATHNGQPASGQCDCNRFDGGTQCFGYANKIFYEIFGVYASKMEKRYDTSNVSVGDWIRCENDNHSAVVIAKNGNNLTIAEANRHEDPSKNQNCMIHWDRVISVSSLNYFKHATNYDTVFKQNTTPHTHNYTEYVYYWKSHPHYKCYKCSCGEVKENRNETTFLSDCEQCLDTVRPNKVTLKDMKSSYNVGEKVVLKWDDSDPKATHFSTRVEKKQSDGTWKYVSGTQYAESGKDTHTFNAGRYRAHVIAYTSKYWEADKSDWLHASYDDVEFDVVCPHSNVTTTTTKKPTCTEKGESTSKCNDCGETFKSEIPATGHDWGGPTIAEPTCTVEGFAIYSCKNCGETKTENTAGKAPHFWDDGVVTTPATVEAPGVKTYTCRRCGETKTEEIPKLDAGDDTPGEDPAVDNGAVISVSSASANPGETVDLKVSISGNPGINTFSLGFDYDTDRLTLQNVTAADVLGGQFTYAKKAVWLNSTDSTYNGEILTLTFKVNDNAPAGSAAVKATYQPGDISNYNEENVDFKLNAGDVNVGDSSASGFVISVSSAEAAPGDTVDLDVNISNNPGINTFSFGFEYDANVLELTAVNIAPELGGQFTYAQKAVWLASQDTSFNGKILTLTFKVKSGAPLGAATVSVTCAAGDISNYKEEDIAFKLTAGQINVVGAYMLGDVDLNGKVDAVDARLALRAAAKLDTLTGVRLINADVDENNVINAIDARKILRVAAKLESMIQSQA